MKTEKISVYFVQGYAGGVKAGAFIDDVEYVIDIEPLKALLAKMIEEKGYRIDQSSRQKYPRLHIND